MKAITTRYLGPTDYKGSRVVADDGDGNRVILSWRSELNSDRNHANAAAWLCQKMKWTGRLQGGDQLKAGRTVAMVWTWIDKLDQITIK